MNVVSIDWDYVTGSCDNGGCCGFCSEPINKIGRGVGNKKSRDWKNRFNYLLSIDTSHVTNIYVAECHASIMEVIDSKDTVFDFDFHYDAYSDGPILKCENWVNQFFKIGGSVVSARFRNDDILDGIRINKMFLCNSSPWTPVSMDVHLFSMIKAFCERSKISPTFIGHVKNILQIRYKKFLDGERKWKEITSL